jgi:elongation factor G
MKVYETSDLRNVALVGHGHSGKTALTSALLLASGATPRLENITDFDDEEIARKITISSSVAACEWKGKKINLIDTPGFNIFINDTRGTLIAADAALVVVDGIAGVEVQTEKVWSFTDEFVLPRAIVINKLDRERSSFDRILENVQSAFGRTAIPIHLPIGAEKDFKGIVDLVRMKSYVGGKEGDIPANLADAAKAAHEALVEMVAEGNDALLEEFFAEGTLPVEHIQDGLREAVRVRRISPVLCASATGNVGSDLLLSFINEHFPSPLECGSWKGKSNGKEVDRPIKDSGPVSLFVFKTVADAFAGRVSYFKVISGVLKNDAHLVNARSSVDERLSHIGAIFGKTIQPLTELHAGDLGAVAKLRDTLTADTLADKAAMIEYPEVRLPEPSIAYAIAAKTRNDEDRMGNAIHKILEEDRSLRFYRDPQTKEFLLAGCGQQHIEIIVSRLKKRYGVEVALHAPKIPYRETIRGRAEVQGRHKKQTGGHGQFGDCWIRLEPLARGGKFEFANEVFGGAIPKNFIPAIEKGILETAERGYLAGFPVVDFKVVVYDGSYHDVDSSEMSFKLAARKAFRAGMEAAKPSLLEPVMNVEVQAPVEFAGDLMGDMNSRRGRISGMDTKGGTQIIKAQVPMAEMLDYLNVLTSMTQGRGSFSMEFDHYDFVPGLQAEKIIAAAKAARAGEEEEEE